LLMALLRSGSLTDVPRDRVPAATEPCHSRVAGSQPHTSAAVSRYCPTPSRPRPFFYPPALYWRLSNRVERCCVHCAVGAAAFRPGLVRTSTHRGKSSRSLTLSPTIQQQSAAHDAIPH